MEKMTKEQMTIEWKEFCLTRELPEKNPSVVTKEEFLKMSRTEVEKRMDEAGCGGSSMEELDETAKSQGDIESIMFYLAVVVFINPNEIKSFTADTKEEMTTKISKAANGREYVARYTGVASLRSSTK